MIIPSMKTKINLLWIVVGFVGGWATLIAQVPEGQLIDKVIASVDDQPIFYTDLEAEYQLHQAQGTKEKTPTKVQILENMVVNKILLANAAKKGIHIKKEEIERYLRARMETIMQQVGTEARLEQYLGKSIEVFKDELRKSIREQLTLDHMRRLIIDDITISPQEVKTFFNNLPPAGIPVCPTMVEAYQLVRYPQVVPVGRYKLQDIRGLIQEQGKDFAKLAKEYSEDEATAANGGELGFWKIGQLDPAYEKAALSLSPGEVSDIVETRFGFHLIKLIKRKNDQYNSRHILIKHRTSKQDPKELIKELNDIRTQIIEQKVPFEKAVATYSEDITTIKHGGLLTDGEGGVQMPIDQLPEELSRFLDKMKPGTISEPYLFTIDTGEQAARIVYLKTKVPAHRAALEQDYERIYQLALTTKKQKALEEWLETVKEKAIIQFDPTYEPSRELQKKYDMK
jgi:peptidyl-prolyl cis-trans isomerase SurA